MKWDGAAYADYIKRCLFTLLTDTEKQNAWIMNHKEFTELFRQQHENTIHAVAGECIGQQSVVMNCTPERIEIDFQRILNNSGDRIISMTWSMAARHIRYWVKEEYRQKREMEEQGMTQFNFGTMMSQENQVKQIPVDMLVPYHNHKFTLYEGERLDDMVESIKANGVMTPIVVQPLDDKYEILIGHNRWNASKLAGKDFVPAIIKENLSEDEAEIYVIESNLIQRGFNELKTSEQAQVLALRYESMFSQGKRTDIINELMALEGKQSETKEKHNSRETVGEEYGLSRNTVARLLRVNKLNDGIKSWVDDGELSIRAAVELSYLNEDEQEELYRTNTDYATGGMSRKISEKTAKSLRAAADETDNKPITSILSGDTKTKKTSTAKSIKLDGEVYERYFSGIDKKEIGNIVEQALEMYFRQFSG